MVPCDVTLHTSPFSTPIQKKLLILKKTGLCDQDRSAVNQSYIEDLIDKVLQNTKRGKYALILSEIKKGNKSIGIGAFALLENEIDAYDRLTRSVLEKSSLLYLVCAKECRGKPIIQRAVQHVADIGKRYILLDALYTNFEYYMNQYGAFSIASEESMKMSIALHKSKIKKGLSQILHQESRKQDKEEYSMAIDVPSVISGHQTRRQGFEAFLEKRICGGLTQKGLPCKKKCLPSKTYCNSHAPKVGDWSTKSSSKVIKHR